MLRESRRGLRLAAWLGWQIESNWADPFLFFIYSILKPIASVMILVVMYLIVSRQETQAPLFAYIYLGNAFYIYVGGIITGVSWAVIDDREHYGTLKYIYLAPFPYTAYLLGRGVARLITASTAVVITLLFGVLFFGLPLRPEYLNMPLFFSSFALGVVSLAFVGLILGGLTLLMTRESWEIGEAVAGALYLFSGAIFPLSVLPDWLRPIGLALPITYWLELIRRSILGSTATAFPTFSDVSDTALLAILGGMTLVYGLIAAVFFRWAEERARRLGLLDVETQF